MKASPIQLLHLAFRKISVELDDEHQFNYENSSCNAFDFNGVTLKTKIGIEELLDDSSKKEGAHVFQIGFDLMVDNDFSSTIEKQVVSPYLIDIRAVALVQIPPGAERLAPPYDLAVVNGAALIWSAFREQLTNLTCRMPNGPVMLPSVHFHDLKSTQSATPPFALNPEAKAKKVRSSRKAPPSF